MGNGVSLLSTHLLSKNYCHTNGHTFYEKGDKSCFKFHSLWNNNWMKESDENCKYNSKMHDEKCKNKNKLYIDHYSIVNNSIMNYTKNKFINEKFTKQNNFKINSYHNLKMKSSNIIASSNNFLITSKYDGLLYIINDTIKKSYTFTDILLSNLSNNNNYVHNFVTFVGGKIGVNKNHDPNNNNNNNNKYIYPLSTTVNEAGVMKSTYNQSNIFENEYKNKLASNQQMEGAAKKIQK
ncbi:hypothetical protein MKS88_004470 [Plasmodium brasilianum]|uniref:Uncharacterized protein n=2 Tax=Plasmodium (Plasmodium) TaxID=418103 RepID=A0ACB9Y7K4_PLABR|nr:hypothetical protein MKS88_004470 [Plasmodium brasilianum]